MRTTVTLDDDVAAAVDRLRREQSLGFSAAVNQLVRAGLTRRPSSRRERLPSYRLGARIDLSNVAEALELVEGSGAR